MFKKHDNSAVNKWKSIIVNTLNTTPGCKDKYALIDCHDKLGNIMLVFAKKSVLDNVSDIYHDTVKDGFLNQVNKKFFVF